MSSKAVAQHMRAFLGDFAGAHQVIFDHALNGTRIDALPLCRQESGLFGIVVGSGAVKLGPGFKMRTKSFLCAAAHWDYALFGSLSQHLYLVMIQVNIGSIKVGQFAEADPCSIKKLEDSTVLGRAGRISGCQLHQSFDTFSGNCFGQWLILLGDNKQMCGILFGQASLKSIFKKGAKGRNFSRDGAVGKSAISQFAQPQPNGQSFYLINTKASTPKIFLTECMELIQIGAV